MFMFFAISAWTLILTGSLLMIINIITLFNTGIPILNEMSLWLIKPVINIVGDKSDSLGTYLNDLATIGGYKVISVIIYGIIGGVGVILSIIEFVRIKKKQKIQKPFVKVILVGLAVLSLFMGQAIAVLFAALLFISFILLEILLFDTESLNNYAEERNLISIYREEKKFEREVNKEGKWDGNTDSINLKIKNQAKTINTLDQNEKALKSDNFDLINIVSEFENKFNLLEEAEKSVLPQVDFNIITDQPSLTPESIIDTDYESSDLITKKEQEEYIIQYKNLKSRLDQYKNDSFIKASEMDEEGKKVIETKYNEKVDSINSIVDLLGWDQSYKISHVNFDKLLDISSDDSIILDINSPEEKLIKVDDNEEEFLKYQDTNLNPEIDQILNNTNSSFEFNNQEEIFDESTQKNEKNLIKDVVTVDLTSLNNFSKEDSPNLEETLIENTNLNSSTEKNELDQRLDKLELLMQEMLKKNNEKSYNAEKSKQIIDTLTKEYKYNARKLKIA